MKSAVSKILPARVKRALSTLGRDVAIARKKRNLTVAMMTERLGIAKSTYLKIEKGDPTVSMGAYAMTFFVLGFPDALDQLVDPGRDEQGLILDAERLPKRVRRRSVREGL